MTTTKHDHCNLYHGSYLAYFIQNIIETNNARKFPIYVQFMFKSFKDVDEERDSTNIFVNSDTMIKVLYIHF